MRRQPSVLGAGHSVRAADLAATRPMSKRSNRPVLDRQPWNLTEVGQIFREEQSVLRDRDGRDSQIHRPDAQLQPKHSLKLCGGAAIESDDWTRRKIIEHRVRSGVGCDLLVRGFGSRNVGEPPAHLLLETDNAHDHLVIGNVEPRYEMVISRAFPALDDAQDIRVQDDHARLEPGLGRCALRYVRPSLTISSKTGSPANRPAWERYHLRLTEGFRRARRCTVCSRAFTRLSI